MARRTPLHDLHAQLGATFTDFAGWTMPVRYGSDLAEHNAVRTTAGIFDLCHMAEIEVAGPEAAPALDHALVGRPSAIAPGRARYSMLCDDLGGVLDDLVVYRRSQDRYLIVANASNREVVAAALAERAERFDAETRDASEDWALIAVQGPAASAVIGPLTDIAASELKYYSITEATVADVTVLLARTGYTDEGFEVYCRPAETIHVWRALSAAGTAHGLVPAGLACRDTLRLEAGMPLYGHELSRAVTPFEAGLGRVVNFDKEGGFVGDEALAKRRDAGPERVLVGLSGDGRRPPRADYAVLDPATGEIVGAITSGTFSPTLRRAIALAYVAPALGEPGTRVTVNVRGSHQDYEVCPLPFYRRPAGHGG